MLGFLVHSFSSIGVSCMCGVCVGCRVKASVNICCAFSSVGASICMRVVIVVRLFMVI